MSDLFDLDLFELGARADALCRRLHPEPWRTYVADRNINYTNICTARCSFCAFRRDEEGYLLSDEEILAKVSEAVELGATEILMQGGLHPELTIDWYEKILRKMKAHPVHIHSLSPPEVVNIARVSDLSVEETLGRLWDAGLDSLPGGGAEIFSVRKRESPGKCSAEEWLSVMRTAHRLGMRSTATMMFGHTETRADRLAHMEAIKRLQDETGGFTAFIPWTFQPERVGPVEYLKTLAVSRLVLDNFENIQASWVTQGEKVAQVALHFGANDLGGTMIEENVVAAAGHTFAQADVPGIIRAAGFEPRQRDTLYAIITPC
ncbi:MAG: cyclic dehypoxanthinyl futalosine synthase [Armatimonadota bacterium]